MKLDKGLRITGVESIMTLTGESDFQDYGYKASELLKHNLHEYDRTLSKEAMEDSIALLRQEFHRNAFLGLGHRKVSKEVDLGRREILFCIRRGHEESI